MNIWKRMYWVKKALITTVCIQGKEGPGKRSANYYLSWQKQGLGKKNR